MSIFYRISFVLMLLFSSNSAHAELDEILADYRRTLPVPQEPADNFNETALRATQFVCQFLENDKRKQLGQSLDTLDHFAPIDSLMGQMSFYNFYRDTHGVLQFKSPRDQKIGSIYSTFLSSLQRKSPVVGYLYGSAFKSAYVYDLQSHKGKVLSRDVDLQERIEYETYRYLMGHLRHFGIDFHFVIIRDDFHAHSLCLHPSEKIYKDAPEITKYGSDIHRISQESEVTTLDLQDLRSVSQQSFETFIEHNLEGVLGKAKEVLSQRVSGLKSFLKREYEYEVFTNTQKEKRALVRAKRYSAMKDFVREHEKKFLPLSLKSRFGMNAEFIPFSIHAEDYIANCNKIPLRTILNFLGGCNAQHQLPLLQKRTDGTYKFYTIRSDFMKKVFQKRKEAVSLVKIENYQTFFYSGDDDIEMLIRDH